MWRRIDVLFPIIISSNILVEYLRTSSPGLALTRIIEMMEGFYTCEIFQNTAIPRNARKSYQPAIIGWPLRWSAK